MPSHSGFTLVEHVMITRPPMFWAWCCLCILGLIETIWLVVTPLSLSRDTLNEIALIIGTVMGMGALSYIFANRPRWRCFFMGNAFLFAAWPVLRLFNHLTMTLPMPLADPLLARWDQAIGFDWMAYAHWLDQQPALLRLMSLIYANLTGYSCLLFILLTLGREPEKRCREMLNLFLITALTCTTIGALFPALAAMTYYAPPSGTFELLRPTTGAYHLGHLLDIRSNPAHIFDLSDMPGLVSFPSFHTAMGIVAIWCARGTPWLSGPFFVINGIMIASTPVLGSHYGVDILAGMAVAASAIAIHLLIIEKRPLFGFLHRESRLPVPLQNPNPVHTSL